LSIFQVFDRSQLVELYQYNSIISQSINITIFIIK
jgi:hypothetical protein